MENKSSSHYFKEENMENEEKETGFYECFNCLARAVIWDADFTFEDYGYEGEGLIHQCHCENCGAIITYEIPYEEE